MRKSNLALVFLALELAGCSWVEEQKQRAGREQAETDFVEAVASSPPKTIGESLERDPTLANAFRRVIGRRSRNRAETALTFAIGRGRRDNVLVLLEKGADPNLVDGTGACPLSAALSSEKDKLAMVTLLLERGADPTRPYRDGMSVLHEAAGSRAARDMFPMLLARASGVGGPDARGRTPLHHAAAGGGEVAAIRLLVQKGADVNVRTTAPQPDKAWSGDLAGRTPLAFVAEDRQIAAAATLCALGADPDAADSTGASARQVAERVAATEGKKPNPTQVDLVRHQNMAAFLARGGGCDALAARRRAGQKLADAEVQRIANESECDAGWGWACGQAGWAYYQGEGAKENGTKALALFQKGCESVLTLDEWCCGMTGILYINGTGVAKDPGQGAHWLSRGCETSDPGRSDAQACNRLGLLYADGSGVPKDLARAQALFKKACDRKYEKGCENLAKYR